MSKNCLDKYLLANSGTSQMQRELEALSCTYAQVDERTDYSSLIIFAKKYGKYLNFYNVNNSVTGDWGDVMGKDVAVAIATVASWNMTDYHNYITNICDYIVPPDPSQPSTQYSSPQVALKYLFDFIASIATAVNDALSQIPSDISYQQFLMVSTGSKLAIPLSQLIAYYNEFAGSGYIDTGTSTDPYMPFDEKLPFQTIIQQFSFINIPPASNPWIPTTTTDAVQILISAAGSSAQAQIINNNLFINLIQAFINGIAHIVTNTKSTYLKQVITNYTGHTPHYALYLTFLRLFKNAQEHLNEFTCRHLEFYYKKVLQLTNNRSVPDNVNVVFQLQKNSPQCLLSGGTQMKAGKDANNNNLFYALTNDIVVNQASVQLLKSLFVNKNNGTGNNHPYLFASPTANSANGQGGALTTPDQSWYPFGDTNNTKFLNAGSATTGFAIASDLLYLNEGGRTITLKFACSQNATLSPLPDLTVINTLPAGALSVQFTGSKNWFDASSDITSAWDGSNFTIKIILNGTAPPVVPYSPKIHGGNFPQALPMVQVLLNVSGAYNVYAALKSLIITSVAINVNVDNLQNLVLQNKDGKIDPSKPFAPFGAFPPNGSPFIIGSKEIFQKNINTLTLNITWQDTTLPADTINECILIGGQWSPGSGDNASPAGTLNTNPSDSTTTIDLFAPIKDSFLQSAADFTANQPYTITSINGFLQLILHNSSDKYSLSTYINSVTPPSLTFAKSGSHPSTYTATLPATTPAATSPVATSVNMSYTAGETFLNTPQMSSPLNDYNGRSDYFYHIEPFGFREMHPYLITDALSLFPVFDMDDGAEADNGGELWIGLQSTQPGETHSILFQVAAGTSDPLKSPTTITWFYMRANNWIQMDPPKSTVNDLSDGTNDLTQSGLVVFNMQGDETTSNTRGDAGYLWLKAVALKDTNAVCKIIAVLANACDAQFVENPGINFTANIAANTLSKLAVPNAAIKQVTQPYPSYGGVPVETNPQFNQRVSERLRHKKRAVTAWDYERLVLQEFPQIHKVKCLDHTFVKTDGTGYSELKPGNVMIVTIPDLSLLTGADPLLPFTNIALLDNIKKFLEPLTSPFIKLHVCNPQFEGIQLNFSVCFINDNANFNFYINVLNNDIEEFLLPWAFGSAIKDIDFGGTVELSTVLNFVQNRPYVEYVTCFTMNHYIYDVINKFVLHKSNTAVVTATTARSILVPYSYTAPGTTTPVTNNIISPANCNCNG